MTKLSEIREIGYAPHTVNNNSCLVLLLEYNSNSSHKMQLEKNYVKPKKNGI